MYLINFNIDFMLKWIYWIKNVIKFNFLISLFQMLFLESIKLYVWLTLYFCWTALVCAVACLLLMWRIALFVSEFL